MNIAIFDTETTSIDKPFCYNIGYSIRNEHNEIILEKDFVVEQIWYNRALFTTAYYADKRSIYVNSMKGRKTIMKKFGYICQEMIRDFKQYNVEMAFAYNSSFDERVFEYNCDWFKCNNPFDTITVKDIRAFAHAFIVNGDYIQFCEQNEYFTESGNYSTTAETVYKYITDDTDFVEAHTALADSQIESDILFACVESGANLLDDYKAKRSINRPIEKTLHIQTAKQEDYYFEYKSIRMNKDKTEIKLK